MNGATIRLASVGKLFRSGGFELSRSWATLAVDALTEEQLETLRVRRGRWIRVHPADIAKVDALLGVNAPEGEQTDKPAEQPASTSAINPITTKAAKAAKKAAKAGKES